MTLLVAPSLLAADFGRLAAEAARAEDAGADLLHLDIMDGHFVPNLTFGPDIVRAIRKATRGIPLDVHLMVQRPDDLASAFADAGAAYLTVHAEAGPHLHRSLQNIKKLGAKAGVAVNPATSVDFLPYVAGLLDLVLVMSVNPGFGGQTYIPEAVPKVRAVRASLDRLGLSPVLIEVDGGVSTANAGSLAAAGAQVLVAGSALFKQADLATAITGLRAAACPVA